MNIDVSQIVNDKLAQLEADGTIKRKIEESLEKTIMSAITSELESYAFKNKIGEQLRASVNQLSDDCGLAAYNGFISEKCRAIVQNLFNTDFSEKVQKALDDIMLRKHENIKLSDIFKRYREWVLANTDESDKYERQEFTSELDVNESGAFTWYTCRFADHPLDDSGYCKEKPEIEFTVSVYRDDKTANISTCYINGHYMQDSFKVGHLTDFEAFILNLYYNGTKIIVDADDVDDDDCYFYIDI